MSASSNKTTFSFHLFGSLYALKSSNNAFLYRICLPSNTATPLALFVRIQLLCFCSCIRQQTCVVTNMAIDAQIMTKWF